MSGPPVIVVSGVPRSGTSMLMQMLVAGGVPPLADDTRPPDDSNPKGYFELDAVKRLPKEPDALAGAGGQCVKVIHRLLAHLPPGQAYGVIFVRRDPAEIAASQASMLDRLGKPGGMIAPDRLAAMIGQETDRALGALRARTDTRILEIEHASVIAYPAEAARTIAGFVRSLNGWTTAVEAEAMASAVDRSLHREQRIDQ